MHAYISFLFTAVRLEIRKRPARKLPQAIRLPNFQTSMLHKHGFLRTMGRRNKCCRLWAEKGNETTVALMSSKGSFFFFG